MKYFFSKICYRKHTNISLFWKILIRAFVGGETWVPYPTTTLGNWLLCFSGQSMWKQSPKKGGCGFTRFSRVIKCKNVLFFWSKKMKTQQISLSLKSTYEDFFRFWGPGGISSFKEIVFAKKKVKFSEIKFSCKRMFLRKKYVKFSGIKFVNLS